MDVVPFFVYALVVGFFVGRPGRAPTTDQRAEPARNTRISRAAITRTSVTISTALFCMPVKSISITKVSV